MQVERVEVRINAAIRAHVENASHELYPNLPFTDEQAVIEFVLHCWATKWRFHSTWQRYVEAERARSKLEPHTNR